MASIKVCFAVGLFIIALSPTGFAEGIPDDVVYTEIKKTLVNGTKGILTCQFKGIPNAVYWIKGSGTDVDMSFITWAYGSKSGPRYEDGSCDMDENYSLIINNIEYADAGHYICEVSSYKGFLIYNYTDVTITSKGVKTQQGVSFQMGEIGVLPCQVNIRPKMVSWLKGINSTLVTMDMSGDFIEKGGPGYEEGLFNMSKEYSLVISDVTIQHEGYFFCEVTDFDTDKLYRDGTMLTVFAQPMMPFPVIRECPIADQSYCIITTDSSVILTCNVNQYYPHINLVFMHGSERVESLTTLTWNNTDGTKNKSITISADISHDVYKCSASGIPGFDLNDESFSSVRLIQHVQEQSNSPILAVLIVPIVICLTALLLAWMRLRKRDQVLYVELWKLVGYVIERQEMHKLDSLIALLDGNEESLMNGDQEYYYHELCRWKENRAWTKNRRKTLYDKCSQIGLDESVQRLEDFRHQTSVVNIPPSDFEHILWHINEPVKMRKFLVSLGIGMIREAELAQKKEIVEEAVQKLPTWNSSKLGLLNPVIIICSTLEMLGYSTADNNFFQIPNEKKDKLSDYELQRFTRDVTSHHQHKLQGLMKSKKGEIKFIDKNENDKVLFDMKKMLRDCLDDMECSNYDKRRKLGALSYVPSHDSESSEKDHYLSDEELRLIAHYLNSTSMAHLCDKLHMTCENEDAGEEERFEVLCQWRTSVMKTAWMTAYAQLRSSLEKIRISGLLQPLRNDPIHKAEYVDIAFDLLMTDIRPVDEALGVNVNKLPLYRPLFEAAHLQKGTIGLVAELVESVGHSRLGLCNHLRDAGFPWAVVRNIHVNHMAYGELYNISDAMRVDNGRLGVHTTSDDEEKEGENLLKDKDGRSTEMKIFIDHVDEASEEQGWSNGHFSDIKKMLQLTDEEILMCTHPSEPPDEFTLFRIWKQRPHPTWFHERIAVIQGLLNVKRPDIARSVVEGKYYLREVSLHFIKYFVKRMDENKRKRFVTAFNLHEEFVGAHGSADDTSKIVHGFLRNWKTKSELWKCEQAECSMPTIDKLVETGFLDIARELSIVNNY